MTGAFKTLFKSVWTTLAQTKSSLSVMSGIVKLRLAVNSDGIILYVWFDDVSFIFGKVKVLLVKVCVSVNYSCYFSCCISISC